MIKAIVYLVIFLMSITLFTFPWLASTIYMATSILQPQAIWPWGIEGIPIYKISAGAAIIGFIVMALRNQIDWSIYRYKQNLAILGLCLLTNLSNTFTPFPVYIASVSSDILIGTFNIIVLMYFVLIGTLQHKRNLAVLLGLFIAVIVYYVYWANGMYFGNVWEQFKNNRLMGPFNTPYSDGNAFSILLVMAMPFFLMGYFYTKSKILKVGIVLFIPLLWHAVLLAGSRGALLSLGVVTLICAFLIRSKSLNIILLIGLALFVVTQGKTVIDRSYATYSVVKNQTDIVNPRIVSWTIAAELSGKHPLLGVGPERFLTASDHYFPGKSPHVAHNTLLSISANLGIPAMCLFGAIFIGVIKRFWTLRKSLINNETDFCYFLLKASTAGIGGYLVGSMFLDLMIFEPFYMLLLVNLVSAHLCKQEHSTTINESSEVSVQTDTRSVKWASN